MSVRRMTLKRIVALGAVTFALAGAITADANTVARTRYCGEITTTSGSGSYRYRARVYAKGATCTVARRVARTSAEVHLSMDGAVSPAGRVAGAEEASE